MSSSTVRSAVTAFLAANSAEVVVDLTAEYGDLRTMLADLSIQPDAPWLGLDFTGSAEDPVSLLANNDTGLYREYGMISLHVVAAGKLGVGASIIARGDALRDLFRGRRIGDIVVESVSPVNTGPGATLEFEAGYVSGTVNVMYYADKNL